MYQPEPDFGRSQRTRSLHAKPGRTRNRVKGAVLAGNRRELVALRASDGTTEWSFQFPETVRGIGTSPDILYIGTLAGPVFAYSPKP